VIEIIDFQDKKWVVRAKVEGCRVDDPSSLKDTYNADMVIRDPRGVYFILEKVIDVEYQEIEDGINNSKDDEKQK
jgi:hypothetical protein